MKLYKLKENSFLKSRSFLMLVGIGALFGVLSAQFFRLQVVEKEIHSQEVTYATQKRIETIGARGLIFDRFGKPLATNKPVYTLKIDQQIQMSKKELNQIILEVVKILEANGDAYIDQIPFSKTAPFIFTENESGRKRFINSIPYNGREHRDEILKYTAQELFEYLRSEEVFQVDEGYTEEEARKIIAVRHQMYQLAYQKYKPITIATDISQETLAEISEHYEDYPNIFSEIESYRQYTYGKEFGNVLGYTRKITNKQLETMQELGYDPNDIIGQMGIEQTMEDELRGKRGIEIINVDNVGRKVNTLEKEEPSQGNNIFLTLDTNIQLKTYEAIEKRLAEAIIQRMVGGLRGVESLAPREILISMVESNQLDVEKMKGALEGTMQHQLYNKLLGWIDKGMSIPEYTEKLKGMTLKEFLVLVLQQEKHFITDRELLLVLSEQGSLRLSENLVRQIWKGSYPSLREILIEELRSGDLKPDQMAIDPFSASAVVIEVGTGNVLAVVGYPSYDSNEMTTDFNTYYSMLQDGIDERNLLWNRALRTAKAPGSTFKMISALAGLEEGVVDINTVISDSGPYTKAGEPHPKCWFYTNNGYGHGNVDVHRALEVSCNIYFYELAHRLGLKYGMPYGAIDIFTKYGAMFGLDKKTGIELDETPPNVSNPENLVKSNMIKAFNVIRNVSAEGQKKLDGIAIELVKKGIYPIASSKAQDFYGKLENSVQRYIKGEVDRIFKEVDEEKIIDINQSLIEDFKQVFKNGVTEIAQRLVNDILIDSSKRSLKVKTKEVATEYLNNLVSDQTYNLILDEVDQIGNESILNLYFNTFEAILEGKDIEEFSSQEIQSVKEIQKAIKSKTLDGALLIADKIQVHLVKNLVDYLLDDVDLEWTNAINVRTAIGQGNNAFTPIQIGRYIAGLANGEKVFDLKLVNGIMDNKSQARYNQLPDKLLQRLEFKEQSLNAVYEGMYRVVNGKEGSARNAFVDSNTIVAGKTGTAEEFGTEHSWFAGFAPYDNPEVVVVTTMYDSYGLGKYNYLLANDIFNAIFAPADEQSQATVDNQLIQ